MRDDPNESVTEVILQALTLSVIFWVQFVLIVTVLVVFGFSKSLRACNNNIFVINLVLSDFIFAIIVMSTSMVDIVCSNACGQTIRTGFVCQMTGFVTTLHYMMAGYTLAIIAIDRYLAVVRKACLHSVDKRKPWFIVLGILWILAINASSIPLLPHDSIKYVYNPGTKHCSPDFENSCWFFWFSAVNGLGAIAPTMTFSYVSIVREVRRQRQNIKCENIVTECSSDAGCLHWMSSLTAEREVAKRGIVMVLVHLLCWTPYTIIHLCPVKINAPLWMEITSMWMVFTLTIWNPIIYVFHNRQFINELRRLVARVKCKILADH